MATNHMAEGGQPGGGHETNRISEEPGAQRRPERRAQRRYPSFSGKGPGSVLDEARGQWNKAEYVDVVSHTRGGDHRCNTRCHYHLVRCVFPGLARRRILGGAGAGRQSDGRKREGRVVKHGDDTQPASNSTAQRRPEQTKHQDRTGQDRTGQDRTGQDRLMMLDSVVGAALPYERTARAVGHASPHDWPSSFLRAGKGGVCELL